MSKLTRDKTTPPASRGLLPRSRLPKLKLPPTPAERAARSYRVGYGKPPSDHRFKPGQSGNSKGRPKGAKNKTPRLNEERLKSIVIAEAYRGIKVNDGPRQVTMPIAQAVVRSLAVNAVKGHARAQRLFAELLSSVETSNKALHDQWVNTALDYKNRWTAEIERCKRLGLPDPDPVPHPDHIEMDLATGEIVVDGPMTPQQRDAGRTVIRNLMDNLDEIDWLERAAARTRDPERRRFYLDQVEQEVAYITRTKEQMTRVPWLIRAWADAVKAQGHGARSTKKRAIAAAMTN
jgi:hypothetical protein